MPSIMTRRIINRADEILATEANWTQGTSYRDAAGLPRSQWTPSCQCCLLGALDQATRELDGSSYAFNQVVSVTDKWAQRWGFTCTSAYNDASTFEQVKQLLHHAAESV